jgi:hypothetical protein
VRPHCLVIILAVGAAVEAAIRPGGPAARRTRSNGELAIANVRHIGRGTIGRHFTSVHFTRAKGTPGESMGRRSANASLCGCCTIRFLNGPASALTVAKLSTCLEARSAAHLYGWTEHGSIGGARLGSFEIGGMPPRSGFSGSASRSAACDDVNIAMREAYLPTPCFCNLRQHARPAFKLNSLLMS